MKRGRGQFRGMTKRVVVKKRGELEMLKPFGEGVYTLDEVAMKLGVKPKEARRLIMKLRLDKEL